MKMWPKRKFYFPEVPEKTFLVGGLVGVTLRTEKYATCIKRLHVTKGSIRKHFIAIAPRHAGRSLIIGGL